MSDPGKGQAPSRKRNRSHAPKDPRTRYTSETLREQARAWTEVLGPRAAARKLGIPEGTVQSWAHRYNWPVPRVFKPFRDYASKMLRNQGATIAHEAMDEVIRENGQDSRLYLSSAGLKASHEAATRSGSELLDRNTSQAVLNTARSLDVTHGWTVGRTQGVNVGVQVNVPMPSAEERAEIRELDRKLDAIAARIRAQNASQAQ